MPQNRFFLFCWKREVAKKTVLITVYVTIKEKKGAYLATAPAFPGLVIDGENLKQVKRHFQNGLLAHLETLAKYNIPIPSGKYFTIESWEKINREEGTWQDTPMIHAVG